MNSKFNPDIDVNTNNETGCIDCPDPAQPPSTARYPSSRLGRLGAWMAARMKAHEDRVSSLRVYSQHRLDGRVTNGRKDA